MLNKKDATWILGYYFVGYVLLAPFLMGFISVFTSNSIIYSGLPYLIIMILIYRKSKVVLVDDWKSFKSNLKANMVVIFKSQAFMYLTNLVINSIILLMTGLTNSNNQDSIQMLAKTDLFIAFFSIVIFAPFVEEMVFRCSIFSLFDNKKVAFILATCMFGLMHVVSSFLVGDYLDLVYFLTYASLGYWITKTYIKTNSIWSSIVLHMINNSFSLILILILF